MLERCWALLYTFFIQWAGVAGGIVEADIGLDPYVTFCDFAWPRVCGAPQDLESEWSMSDH